MKRASLMLCALCGAILIVTGCNMMELGLDVATTAGDASIRVLDGSPDVVAVNLQGALKSKGFEATVRKSGDTTLVESKTSSGLKFALLLTSHPGANGKQQTHVALEWADTKDPQAAIDLLVIVGGSKK
jgi:hypothetical protein